MARPVCIVIPVFNKWDLTEQCLVSLRERTDPGLFEVVVVDNASSDATPQACLELGQGLFGEAFGFLRFETNRNFGPACNAGARSSESPIVLFLNNDTIVTPGWLERLLPVVRQEATGAVSPLLLYPRLGGMPDLVEHVGLAFDPLCHPTHLFEFFHCSHPAVRAPRHYRALTGAALCLRREVFERVGGFHEAYANGGEDVDLTLHVSALGLALRCCHEAVVYHLKGQTPGRHSHEGHNVEVFKARCLDLVSPDLVHFARRAGFEMELNESLQVSLLVPERRKRFLERCLAQARTRDDLYALVRKEPVFFEAYQALAEQELAHGKVEQAMMLAYVQARIGRRPADQVRLRDLAALAGDADMFDYADKVLQGIANMDFGQFRMTARAMADSYDKVPELEVAYLFRQWLERADEIEAFCGRLGA